MYHSHVNHGSSLSIDACGLEGACFCCEASFDEQAVYLSLPVTHHAEWAQTEEGRQSRREGGMEGGGSKEGRELEVQCVYLKRACSLSGGRGGRMRCSLTIKRSLSILLWMHQYDEIGASCF